MNQKLQNLERGLSAAVFVLLLIFFQTLPKGLGSADLLTISGFLGLVVSIVLPIVVFSLASAVAVTYGMVSVGRMPISIALVLATIAGIAVLGTSLHFVAFCFITAYSLLYYSDSSRREAKERKKISVNRCTLWGLSNMTFTFVVGISLAFFLWYNPLVMSQGFQIPAPLVSLSANFAVSTFTGQGCVEEMKIGECIDLVVSKEEARLRADARERCKSDDLCYNNVDKQITAERPSFRVKTVDNMESQLGVKIDEAETVRETIVHVIETRANDFFGPNKQFIAPALALTLFSILNGASVIIFPLVLFFSTAIFKMLVSLGLVKVELRVEQVEDIVIPETL